MNLLLQSQKNKAIIALFVSFVVLVGIINMKNTPVTMDVIDILNKAGIIAPSWIVTAITTLGSVLAIITVLGTLGAGLPLAVLEQLAAASTAAA